MNKSKKRRSSASMPVLAEENQIEGMPIAKPESEIEATAVLPEVETREAESVGYEVAMEFGAAGVTAAESEAGQKEESQRRYDAVGAEAIGESAAGVDWVTPRIVRSSEDAEFVGSGDVGIAQAAEVQQKAQAVYSPEVVREVEAFLPAIFSRSRIGDLIQNGYGSFEETVDGPQSEDSRGVTASEIERMLDAKLASLRVYVLEADITNAQNAMKSVVELASF